VSFKIVLSSWNPSICVCQWFLFLKWYCYWCCCDHFSLWFLEVISPSVVLSVCHIRVHT
jgi:hypothetical protein